MKKIIVLLATAALMALGIGYAPTASAHTTTGGASCAKAWVHPTKYDGNRQNHWSLTVGGVTHSGTFGSETYQEIAVPQDYQVYDWSYDVVGWNGKYHFSDSGKVGPCGTPPTCETQPSPQLCAQPPADVTHGESTDKPDCVDRTLTTHHWTVTTEYVWSTTQMKWVPGEPVRAEDADTVVNLTNVECPPVVPPKKPKHTVPHTKVNDDCNCYRDSVVLRGKHFSFRQSHPDKTTWIFHVKADKRYLLPSKIGGHSGWARTQVYTVHTTNKVCPCRKNHTCHVKHPNFQAPANHCRGVKPC